MTTVLVARNVNEAFSNGWWKLKVQGIREKSRNGDVIVMPGPVITEYLHPDERVLFSPTRDANHVFHLIESIWMLSGDWAVAPLLQFNKRMVSFAEDDGYQHGAYGHRWRELFGHDQILYAIKELTEQPESRRCVIGMWHPAMDQRAPVKDVPCNTHIYLDVRGGKLNMTVCCRSNDMLWGAYGANAVHFSMLMEVIAAGVGVPLGVYRQFSNNFHVYTSVPGVDEMLANPPDFERTYPAVIPLLERGEDVVTFLDDCVRFMANKNTRCAFFTKVAQPLRHAYLERKAGHPYNYAVDQIAACDWKTGFIEWTQRRMTK